MILINNARLQLAVIATDEIPKSVAWNHTKDENSNLFLILAKTNDQLNAKARCTFKNYVVHLQANVSLIFNNATAGLESVASCDGPYVSEILQKISYQVDESGVGDKVVGKCLHTFTYKH